MPAKQVADRVKKLNVRLKEINGDCIDETCQSIDNNCQTCAYDPLTSTSECLACGDNRIVVNN